MTPHPIRINNSLIHRLNLSAAPPRSAPDLPILDLAFSDFPEGFDHRANVFVKVLAEFFEVRVHDDFSRAQVLVYSSFGRRHWNFPGLKIFYTGENQLPCYEECDFSITFCRMSEEPRNYRLPIYVFYTPDPHLLLRPPEENGYAALAAKTGFCNLMVTNPRAPERNRFFKKLNRRQRVDSGGGHFNNLGHRVRDKLEFIARYKFTIAFENSRTPGYVTEKMVEPLLVRSVPVYWGDPDVMLDFNPKSFINAADYSSDEALIEELIALDRDDDRLARVLAEPCFKDNRLPPWFELRNLGLALQRFLASPPRPGPRRYRPRKLREHTHDSSLVRTFTSLACKLESIAWKKGWR